MNKAVLVVVILAAALTAGLYTLPKVVVQDKNKQIGGQAVQTSGSHTNGGNGGGSAAPEATVEHDKPMSADQLKTVAVLRAEFASASAAQKEIAGNKLVTFFHDMNRYDSAAHYAGILAVAQPTVKNLMRAGDEYFEAYTFAVDEKKTAALGPKTRALYQQALDKDPNLLSAKANMAMTYVNTDTPMKGIMLLREVLAEDPNNELALFDLGLLAMRSNQYSKAVERFRQILVINPGSRKARFYLGISLAEAGQKAEAKEVLAEVKKQEKDPQILAAVREYEERLSQ